MSNDFKMTEPVNRLKGSLPKIGIRPVIDGRRQGVRESLEDQTMNMAKNAANFLTENLKYPNGLPVECVIADTCIGGVAEAALCSEKFQREGVGVSLTVTPCWCYGTEVMDSDPAIPKAVWGFNGTERPGAVYLAAALAGYTQKGLPTFSIYGRDVQDQDDTSIPNDVQEKLLNFAKAGLAVAEMKGKSYLSLGAVSMGIVGSIVNEELFQNYEFDGLEIDFLRSSPYFLPGTEAKNAHLLTSLLKRIRNHLNEVGNARKRPIRLAVRVNESLRSSALDGYDVAAWIDD